ncbi:MAG TPA: hypothetical protein VGS19_24290 [Streptosporangiaceae bacterium]|nr:hypothetical protein [Streptosporangiaceae bacterium]
MFIKNLSAVQEEDREADERAEAESEEQAEPEPGCKVAEVASDTHFDSGWRHLPGLSWPGRGDRGEIKGALQPAAVRLSWGLRLGVGRFLGLFAARP